MALTVVIPTLNEEKQIASTLTQARINAHRVPQLVVVDGGSLDNTYSIAVRAGAHVLRVSGGRAAQLNAGAAVANGNEILFLHADTRLPKGYDIHVNRVLSRQNTSAGAFRLSIDSDSRALKFVAWVANIRARFAQRPYGDQGLFMKRAVFDQVRGYPNMPFMEDYEMVRMLARKGRIRIADVSVITSSRRWDTLGVVRTTVMNQVIIGAYHLGVPVSRLREWYRGALVRANARKKLSAN